MKHGKDSGKVVAQLRKLIGKSQSQFATMIGVSKHTIISVENDRNSLTSKLAKRIRLATGADIMDENFSFAPASVPAYQSNQQLSAEALAYLHQRYDGTGKHDKNYTREDFDQWRSNFYPCNETVARQDCDQLKTWIEYLFRAAAKPGNAGNRDRLPAIRQSLVEWMNETYDNFKLEREVDEILEAETHELGESAFSVTSITKPASKANLEEIMERVVSYGYDFVEVKKACKKAKLGDFIILTTEYRQTWDSFEGKCTIPCANWKLLKKPEIRFEFGYDYMARTSGVSIPDLLSNIPELVASVEELRRKRDDGTSKKSRAKHLS